MLLALRFYTSGNFLEVIGDTMGVDKSTVSRAVTSVTNALCGLSDQYIKWPRHEEMETMKRGFYEIAGFPGVMGNSNKLN